GDLAYARAVIRVPSPTESIDTQYGPDETDIDDRLLSDPQFEQKVLNGLRIHEPTDLEHWNDAMPVRFPRVRPGSQEEQTLYQHTMWSLRKRVTELEENELFNNIMQRGSQISFDTPKTSSVDAIMQSIMGPHTSSTYVQPLH
ncbi:hypothetical protein K488DRAFT_38561, partial [Vararia minispora EC-137]